MIREKKPDEDLLYVKLVVKPQKCHELRPDGVVLSPSEKVPHIPVKILFVLFELENGADASQSFIADPQIGDEDEKGILLQTGRRRFRIADAVTMRKPRRKPLGN